MRIILVSKGASWRILMHWGAGWVRRLNSSDGTAKHQENSSWISWHPFFFFDLHVTSIPNFTIIRSFASWLPKSPGATVSWTRLPRLIRSPSESQRRWTKITFVETSHYLDNSAFSEGKYLKFYMTNYNLTL